MAPKSKRNVLSISEKIKIINMVEVEKKSVSVVARMHNKNESSIREVLKNKDIIRSSFSTAPDTAKVASTVRDKTLVKVEKALNLWVEDMVRKKMPINSIVLREKTLSLYKDMKPENEGERDDKLFVASKGWLHRFRKRYNLKNIKITGESASADVEAATFIVNAPGHPTSLMTKDENVEVVFLPPNTTALLQPLDQEVIRCFKAVYTRQVFDMIRSKVENSDGTGLMECWKSFTIADAIVFTKGAVDFLKPEMITACWKKLLSGEGFDDMTEDELNEHFNDNLEVLTNEELKNLIISSGEESEEDETQEPPASWTLDKFAKVFRTAQTLKDQIMDYDPMMERSINITRKITETMEPLQKLFDELKIQKQQLPITMFLEKIDENSSDDDN
uniref:HTH CENPB-type domain-containing protein n=2 Tax=Strongyloides papillosus TaxID=174720 RepID=A0A0N5BPZ7_STREA